MALTKILIGDTGTQAKAKIDAAMDAVDQNTADISTINNTTIPAVQNDVSTAQGDITTIQGNITTILGSVSNLQGDMTTAQGDITTIQGNITTLQTSVGTAATNAANALAGIDNIYSYSELSNDPNVTLTFEDNKNKRYLKKINSSQNVTISVTDPTDTGTIELVIISGSVYIDQTGATRSYGFQRTINAVAILKFQLLDGYLTYSYTSYETSTVPDLSFYHSTLTVSGNAASFAPTHQREYVDMEITDNTALTVDIQGVNEQYILVHNTAGSAKTVAVAGANSETIRGTAAISVTLYCEISIVRHNNELVITSREL